MYDVFEKVCKRIFNRLKAGEFLTISLGGESSQFIRFNHARIRQTGLVDDVSVSLQLIIGQRTAIGGLPFSGSADTDFTTVFNELERLRKEVIQLPEDPYIVLPHPGDSTHKIHSGELLPREDVASALIPALQEVDMSGIWAAGTIYRGSANSAGQLHWFETESFSFDYSLVTPNEKMVKATFAGRRWDQEKYNVFATESIRKLEKMKLSPVKIKPGKYRTYIAPAGVADLIGMFSWGGLSEAAIQQGDSAFLKMRNEDIRLSPLFTLKEDFSSGTVPRFNSLGEVAPEELPLLEKGRLVNTLVSSRTAKEYGKVSNYADDWEGLRAPAMTTGDLTEKAILEELGTGVYLSNLHYLNWSDRIGGRVTGMTRYACFWVENGEITAPIENMRFDDSFYNFFGAELEAVTDDARFIPDVGTYGGRALGGTVCPGILLTSFALTL